MKKCISEIEMPSLRKPREHCDTQGTDGFYSSTEVFVQHFIIRIILVLLILLLKCSHILGKQKSEVIKLQFGQCCTIKGCALLICRAKQRTHLSTCDLREPLKKSMVCKYVLTQLTA